jgi:hypothetical protein
MSLSDILSIVGIIIWYFWVAIPIWWYFIEKKKEEKDNRFLRYHHLIDELIWGQPWKKVMLQRQIAIIFELRNFPEYYEVTARILESLKNTWKGNERLINEITLTESHIL